MLVGGVIMDVTNAEQARIAEEGRRRRGHGARTGSFRHSKRWRDRPHGARVEDPGNPAVRLDSLSWLNQGLGTFMEAEILEALSADFIDESEVLTPADEAAHIDKTPFKAPFVCGARNLGEALRRISEGAALIRTKGEAGTGDIIHAVRHMKLINSEIKELARTTGEWGLVELRGQAQRAERSHQAGSRRTGRLPVPNFAAGGIATPADAAMMMRLGAEAVFVGSGIFKVESRPPEAEPPSPGRSCEAVTHFDDPAELVNGSARTVDVAMRGEDTGGHLLKNNSFRAGDGKRFRIFPRAVKDGPASR